MNARRTALTGLNAAAALGLLFSIVSQLPDAQNLDAPADQPATIPLITDTIPTPVYETSARILFDPVKENAPKSAELTKPPFRLVGIVSQINESFAVVQIDERTSVQLRLNEQILGWRLDDLYRTSARFASKQNSVEVDLTSAD